MASNLSEEIEDLCCLHANSMEIQTMSPFYVNGAARIETRLRPVPGILLVTKGLLTFSGHDQPSAMNIFYK